MSEDKNTFKHEKCSTLKYGQNLDYSSKIRVSSELGIREKPGKPRDYFY